MKSEPSQHSVSATSFRILALDGGGIRGVFAASFLAEIERLTEKRVVEHFDLIAGTSTGGIIALGIALGLPAKEILSFYEDQGPVIFPATGLPHRWYRTVRQLLFSPKHSQEQLREALAHVLGDRTLADARTRLVIPAYDGVTGRPHIFKTPHAHRFRQDYRTSAVDVALATSAAPTYLPAFSGRNGIAMVDGGVWANSPALLGILEAIVVLDRRREEVEVLSVGTLDEPFSVKPRKLVGGLLQWRLTLLKLFMHAQVQGTLGACKLLVEDRFIRVSPAAEPGRFSLDDSRHIGDLKAFGVQEARRLAKEVESHFLGSKQPPFAPAYEDAANGASQSGS